MPFYRYATADAAELVSKLRAEHAHGRHEFGIDVDAGVVADFVERGILESYNVKLCMLTAAAEAAEQVKERSALPSDFSYVFVS